MYMSKLIIFQQEGYDAVAINPAQVTRVEPVETHIEWSDIHMSDGKVVVVEETFHMAVERLAMAFWEANERNHRVVILLRFPRRGRAGERDTDRGQLNKSVNGRNKAGFHS